MTFPKPGRIKDPELLAVVRSLPCLACVPGRQLLPTDPDHVTTRGAGGHDTDSNVWPLCRDHHQERHRVGLQHMIETYPACRTWLERAGRTDVLDRVGRSP